MGDRPETRVDYLLGKLHSIHVSKNRQSTISENGMMLFSKFTKQVETIYTKTTDKKYWGSYKKGKQIWNYVEFDFSCKSWDFFLRAIYTHLTNEGDQMVKHSISL